MSMRLHFKGDKPEKKKKKRRTDDDDGSRSKKRAAGDEESDVEDVGGNETAWVSVNRPTDLAGPSILYQSIASSSSSSSSSFAVLALNPTTSQMTMQLISPPSGPSTISQELLDGATLVDDAVSQLDDSLAPTDVHQVLVASRVLDTADPPRYTFRTTQGRFLGADKHGSIFCASEARGPQEEFSIVTASDVGGVALRSVHGLYLSLDEVAGGKRTIRADSSEIGPAETWSFKVQWKYRHEARQRERAREIGKGGAGEALSKRLRVEAGSTDEAALMKSRQSYSAPTYASGDPKADRKALKRAIKEGRAAEELLDRRSKLKSDKFAVSSLSCVATGAA